MLFVPGRLRRLICLVTAAACMGLAPSLASAGCDFDWVKSLLSNSSEPLQMPQTWYRAIRAALAQENFPRRTEILALIAEAQETSRLDPLVEAVRKMVLTPALLEKKAVRDAISEITSEMSHLTMTDSVPFKGINKSFFKNTKRVQEPYDLARMLREKGVSEAGIIRLFNKFDHPVGPTPKNLVIYRLKDRGYGWDSLEAIELNRFSCYDNCEVVAVYSQRGYHRTRLLKAIHNMLNPVIEAYRKIRPKEWPLSYDEELEQAQKALRKPPPRPMIRLPMQSAALRSAESDLEQALANLDFVDHTQKPVIQWEGGHVAKIPMPGRRVLKLSLDSFDPEVIFGVRGDDPWADRDPLRNPGRASYNRLLNNMLGFLTQHSPDGRVRQETARYLKMNQQLNQIGYGIQPGIRGRNFDIGPLQEEGPPSINVGSHGPFFDSDTVETPFYEYPSPVRKIVLENWDPQELTLVLVNRVNREIRAIDKLQIGTPYVPFVQEWLLIPPNLRIATLRALSPKVRKTWLNIVEENR